jgi:tetratricopeptide (TPR) repeat protein
MQGSLRQDGEHWIVSADFERVSDAATLWDTAFTVSPDQQTGAAEAIAESLIAALQKQFPRSMGSAQRLAPNQRTSNPEAYRHNMRGQEILTRRTQSLKESADLFRLAIHEDTLFAHAYSGLSMALSLFPYIQGVPTKDVQVELVPAARRAIALDPTLAQPHVALGVSYGFDYLWNEAEAEFTTAIRLDRRNVEARIQYARHLRFRGRNQDAMQQLRVARAEDPASAVVLSHLAYSYYLNHQMDSALKESERAYENDSTNVTTVGYRALILLAAHRPAEARKFAYKRGVASGIYVLARVDTAAARAQLREWDAETSQRWGRGTRRAFTYLGLGELERALTSLEEATKTGEIWYGASSAFDPIFDPIRESPRFKALMRQVRLGQ